MNKGTKAYNILQRLNLQFLFIILSIIIDRDKLKYSAK